MEVRPKRAALYGRVSTLLGQDASLQITNLREFAKARGFAIVEVYEECGVSGAKARRPQLDRLMRDARARKFDLILVAAIDRISRSVKHLLTLTEELATIGVSLISIREAIDLSSPQGKAFFSIMGVLAELERELIRERIRVALAAKKMAALQTGSGWRCGRPTKLNQTLESEVTRLRSEALSIRQISKRTGLSKTSVMRVLQKPV